MPVPQVEPATWNRVAAIAQIEMGQLKPSVSTISFDGQLNLIIENTGGNDRKISVSTKLRSRESNHRYHLAWVDETSSFKVEGRGRKSEKRLVSLVFSHDIPERDRPRRPEVSQRTVAKLESIVSKCRSRVPVEELTFQQLLELYLDAIEAEYEDEKIGVEVIGIEAGTSPEEAIDTTELINHDKYETKELFHHVDS